ncbi:MAG: prepilin-type N-terminal cleavage/methylation domain-containing protein [bacterium]|nr:prepilin-type N-terminal cleavage/methylation domain-containing protein [bacterium]MDD5354387.1 prepilin-type N-terminal cleavage/methylation domain-containing protein [bacterium]MDD5755860.1 prepilin-type N-terminal cleavage/methylation domain-containing protein [bacterium]
MPRIKSNSGFLLIEVLLAVSIFSIGLVVLIQSQAAALRHNETARNLSLASLKGYYYLEVLPDFTAENDEISSDKFQVNVEAQAVSADLEKKVIIISWTEHGSKKELQIDTLRAIY